MMKCRIVESELECDGWSFVLRNMGMLVIDGAWRNMPELCLKIFRQAFLQLLCIAIWLIGLLMLFRPDKFLAENNEVFEKEYREVPGSGVVMIAGTAVIFLSIGALMYVVREHDQPLD